MPKQTANYKLNQWEASDPVLRADFNADNAKIDAAIKAEVDARTSAVQAVQSALNTEISTRSQSMGTLTEQTKLHTILTYNQRSSTQQFTVDLSNVDWSQWRQVYLVFQLYGSGTCSGGFNGRNDAFAFTLNGKKYCFIMTPLYDASMLVSGLMTSATVQMIPTSQTYSEIESLLLHATSNNSSISSATITLKGVK